MEEGWFDWFEAGGCRSIRVLLGGVRLTRERKKIVRI